MRRVSEERGHWTGQTAADTFLSFMEDRWARVVDAVLVWVGEHLATAFVGALYRLRHE